MARSLLAWTLLSFVAACEEAPACPDGQHREGQGCVEDLSELVVTIRAAAGGTSCAGDEAAQRPPTLDPDPFHVGVGKFVRFKNEDVIEHEIRGIDGQLWTTAPAGRYSIETSIARAGSWPYRVSGCAKGGTLIVE